MLDGTADTTPVETPAVTPPVVDPAAPPADPMADAAEKLFPNDVPPTMVDDLGETAEAKAAREAAEAEAAAKPAETPEQKAAREAEEAKKAKEAEGAPETYADFTVPDGIELDVETTDAFKTLAKEFNLSQDKAQKLIDLQTGLAQKWETAAQARADATVEEWRAAITADKEFGGDKLPATLALATKAVKQFGDAELTKLLVEGRLGDNPAMIRAMARVGKAVSEAPIVHGAKPLSTTPESVLYPNLK